MSRTAFQLRTGLACLAVMVPRDAAGQNRANGEPLAIESNLPAEGFVSRYAPIELRVAGDLEPGARLAIFLGTTDASDLFRPVPGGLRYGPSVLSLPAGERDLTVHLVRPDGAWEEVGRFPLRVRNAIGLDRGRVAPRMDLGLEGQLAQGQDAETSAPPRPTYQDFTGQLALESMVERGALEWTTQASVIGVSHRENALRFGERGEAAPRMDLSNYLVRVGLGSSDVSVGHVSIGDQRHLASGFASRGATLTLKPGSRVDLRAGVVNGSSVVGWSNPLGMNDPDHRMASGSMGVEVLPRPGAFRVDLSGLSGSVRPLSGYNQGAVNDAEESHGFGIRVVASDPSQRVRLEGGFARSTFDNPEDSTLAQGGDLVPVEETTRNAHYLEASVDVLRDLQLGARTASLSLGFRRERVDPLYRSLGAFAQADNQTNQLEARATLLGLALQASHSRGEDNLGQLASVLTSRTRRTGVMADAPLPALLGVQSPWLPAVSYSFDRTHQFGEGLPENGEFSDSHIPDQVSRDHTVATAWQFSRLSLAYRFNHSFQDNRQTGRDEADFATRVHGVLIGLLPHRSLSLDLSLDLERAENREQKEADRTRRYGGRASWNPFAQSTLSFSLAQTRAEDEAETRRRTDTVLDAQWSSIVPGLQRLGARYYLRFSRGSNRATDTQSDLDLATQRWSLSSGLSLGLAPFQP